MPDLTAIAQLLTSLKAAKDIGEAMLGLRDAAAFQGKLIEFQSQIIDANNAAFAAQEERAGLLERVSKLEKEISRLEAWETEKQRYQMKDLGVGAIAYVVKASMQGTDPVHCICASCYERGKKSILQNTFHGAAAWTATWVCPDPSCRSKIEIPDDTTIVPA